MWLKVNVKTDFKNFKEVFPDFWNEFANGNFLYIFGKEYKPNEFYIEYPGMTFKNWRFDKEIPQESTPFKEWLKDANFKPKNSFFVRINSEKDLLVILKNCMGTKKSKKIVKEKLGWMRYALLAGGEYKNPILVKITGKRFIAEPGSRTDVQSVSIDEWLLLRDMEID